MVSWSINGVRLGASIIPTLIPEKVSPLRLTFSHTFFDWVNPA